MSRIRFFPPSSTRSPQAGVVTVQQRQFDARLVLGLFEAGVQECELPGTPFCFSFFGSLEHDDIIAPNSASS